MSRSQDQINAASLALAFQLQKNGDLAAAAEIYQSALKKGPPHQGVLLNLAQIRRFQGRIDEAETLYRKATQTKNVDPRAYLNYGCLLLEKNNLLDAIEKFTKALKLKSNYASAYVHRGWAKIQLKDFSGSAQDIQRAMLLEPKSALPFLAMGDLQSRMDNTDAAISNYRYALEIDPNLADAYSGLGSCLLTKGEYEAALKAIESALITKPKSCNALANRGRFHALTGRFDLAINDYLEALAIDDQSPTTWVNLGNAYFSQNKYALADQAFERALRLDSEHTNALMSKAFLYLDQEKYQEGWRLYSARPLLCSSGGKPIWTGESHQDKKLFIAAEHGLGDEIFYGTLLKNVETFFDSIILQVDDRLKELFQRSFPRYAVIGRSEELSADQYDFFLPAGSLPKLFVKTVKDLPSSESYLKVSPDKKNSMRNKLEAFPKPWVGISWVSKNPSNGIIRSVKLEDMMKIFKNKVCTVVSLQYGESPAVFSEEINGCTVVSSNSLGVNSFSDIDGLAAIISACDAVVSVDNSTVHLAGALGVKTYVLLSTPADWRWTQHKTESGWYRSIELVRQKNTFEWEPVLQTIGVKLFGECHLGHSSQGTKYHDSGVLSANAGCSCAVVCPVGPGHEKSFEACNSAIKAAIAHGKGPFSRVEIIPVYDLDGQLGRSRARNIGIDRAAELNCGWIYFIDADDFMTPYAFEDLSPFVCSSDAVWGLICEAPAGNIKDMKLREGQMPPTRSFGDLLRYDPYLSIQMGHFVKTEVAQKVRFDENLNAGEDFKYYLEIWKSYKAVKSANVFFVNCRGNHSTGPRAATASEWRTNSEKFISLAKIEFLK